MKKFIRLTALFLLPFVLFYGLMGLMLVNSREAAPLDEVVEATVSGELVLYGSGYHENFQAYKYRVASRLAPELLVMGTSRSMPLRAEWFTAESFYNVGGAIKNLQDYLRFLQALPEESRPETAIVVLDQNMYNPEWASSARTPQLYLDDIPVKTDLLLRLGNSFGDGKFTISDCLRPKAGIYGVAALGRDSGFAPDGSYRYGDAANANLAQPERNFADTYRNIDFSQLRFAWGDTMSEWAVEETRLLLEWCAENDIRLVGIIAPLPPSVYERMMAAGRYGYVTQMGELLPRLFAEYGFACYDKGYLPDTTAVQYIDGFHGGDEVYAGILLQLAKEDETMARLVDTDTIIAQLQTPHENPRVLPEAAK